MKNVINRALAAKKKIFLGILALSAIVLSSCNENGAHMKNFKIEITELGPTKAVFHVTPLMGAGEYAIGVINKRYFDTYWDNDVANAGMAVYSNDITYTADFLYPASEYVFIVIPVMPNPEGTSKWVITGETEYISFTTPDWPRIDEDGATYTKNGTVEHYKDNPKVKITFYESNIANMYLVLDANRHTGKFTKKDLSSFYVIYDYKNCIYSNYSSYYEYNGTEFPIYDIEFTGTYDVNLKKYIYEGWFIRSDSKFEKGQRDHFKLTCDLVE